MQMRILSVWKNISLKTSRKIGLATVKVKGRCWRWPFCSKFSQDNNKFQKTLWEMKVCCPCEEGTMLIFLPCKLDCWTLLTEKQLHLRMPPTPASHHLWDLLREILYWELLRYFVSFLKYSLAYITFYPTCFWCHSCGMKQQCCLSIIRTCGVYF